MAIRIKPGETLNLSCTHQGEDLTGTSIESAVKRGDFYQPLTVAEGDLALGKYSLTLSDTSKFPTGWVDCDIKYSVGGVVTKSETFRIHVDAGVTK